MNWFINMNWVVNARLFSFILRFCFLLELMALGICTVMQVMDLLRQNKGTFDTFVCPFLLNAGFYGQGSDIDDLYVKQVTTNASVGHIFCCQIAKLMKHDGRDMGNPRTKFQLGSHI
ncbi:hypothetical protein RYX36_027236 [Vicia faba]